MGVLPAIFLILPAVNLVGVDSSTSSSAVHAQAAPATDGTAPQTADTATTRRHRPHARDPIPGASMLGLRLRTVRSQADCR